MKGLLSGAGFKKVQSQTIAFTEKRTIPEVIGNLKTNSSYALMSSEDQKNFVKEMTKAYKLALGKNKYDVGELELRICYGFK